MAVRCGVALNEIGRYDVAITRTEYEDDPELKAKLWERIQARIAEKPRELVV